MGPRQLRPGRRDLPHQPGGCLADADLWDGWDWEIRYRDGATIHEITDNTHNNTQPTLHASFIAWVGRPPDSLDQIFSVSVAK